MDILILGIGNVLLTDEGVGVRALNELERRYTFPEMLSCLTVVPRVLNFCAIYANVIISSSLMP